VCRETFKEIRDRFDEDAVPFAACHIRFDRVKMQAIIGSDLDEHDLTNCAVNASKIGLKRLEGIRSATESKIYSTWTTCRSPRCYRHALAKNKYDHL